MRNFILFLLLSISGAAAHAQQISGIVLDGQSPVAGASVAIRKAADSSVVKYTVTDAKGKYLFDAIAPGRYFFQVSSIGYADQHSASYSIGGNEPATAPVVQMHRMAGDLKQVVVSGRKPVIEVKADKMILNVEGNINAVGEDALELLRKSPGIMVDKDNNISLSGKNGIKIFVDGREVPLNGTDLSDYLKTIQSAEIESIEIISNPSAKYEAAGNAGIINIRLKKNKSYGTNGSLTGGYNLGTHPNYNGGLSLNHRDQRWNLFGNYNYNHTEATTFMLLRREQLDTLFDQQSSIKMISGSHSFKAGVDYFLNKQNTFGILVNGTLSDNTVETGSSTPISYIPTGKVDRILQANNSSTGRRDNGNMNLNYHHTDSLGHELNMDGDYGIYRIKSNQLQPNLYFDPSGTTLLYGDVFNMLAPTDIDIYSFKTDYEQNFAKGRLGLGGKTSFVNSGNDFQQYDVYRASKIMDTLHSNNFRYKENINAVYANYNRTLKGWSLQAGLRVENTNATGVSRGHKLEGGNYMDYDSGFDRHYTGFFPSAAITWNKNPVKQWTLTYSRRIDRPAYQDLNPFEFKLDEYTSRKGNTGLNPQYTNSLGLTYVYKYKLTTTLNYSHVKDVFTQLVDTVDRSKAFITKKNLATQDITSINVSYPFQYKWYSVFANVNAYYSLYQANFGSGRTIDLNVFSLNLYAQQSFTLGKGWTGQLSGFYTSPSVWEGTFKTHAMASIDGGFQKALLKNRATLKASVSDIFNSLHWTATSDFAGQYLLSSGHFESRQLKLYFTYKFGSNQVKTARQRKTSTEEEESRVGAQGGGLGGK
ncbi:MAG TPA: TonB-dependent receptor [Puia sp.]|nr:TonB-dependent receptor [Puia sp.]